MRIYTIATILSLLLLFCQGGDYMLINNPIYPPGVTTIDGRIFDWILHDLPGWNMDINAISNIDISGYGIAVGNIVTVQVVIHNDAQTVCTPLPFYNSATGNIAAWCAGWNSTTLFLERLDLDYFDGANYDDDGISRGYALIGIRRT